ncbi:MAG: 16S rRNA (cytosine(967)-C(5))-methyltransferase RsmB, partial [Clostridia bacterium]|nr:16S rRNA (cytosine(967)-C(5))-methyltransferase RsmB [Clostridia bacterium]
MNNPSPRALALSLLLRSERDKLYSNVILDTAIRRSNLSDADRGLLTALVYGVLEKQLTLDYLIDALSDRPAAKLDDEVRILLRMGLYQLRFMDRIPAHAALNETVSLAPKRARGFVNALLRRYTRESESIALPDRERDPLRYLSVAYSFPQPLCERFVGIFGFDRAEQVFAAIDRTPPLTLRVNTCRTSADELAARLSAAGASVSPALHALHALRLDGGNPTAL